MRVWHALGILGGLVGLGSLAVAQTPSLTLIPTPAGRNGVFATCMTPDGNQIVGYTIANGGIRRGMTWTHTGGLVEWGGNPDVPLSTVPYGVSNTGSVIVGQRVFGSTDSEAFRYSAGAYNNLGPLPSGFLNSVAYGVSGNGSVIVGSMADSFSGHAMRWTTATGMQDVGFARPGDIAAWFTGISRDGSTAIGKSTASISGYEACTWSQNSGWRVLPAPVGAGSRYDANTTAVNGNGSLVLGSVQSLTTGVVFPTLWRNESPLDIGSFGARWQMGANAMSDDASVIAGVAYNVDTRRSTAAIWLNGSTPVALQEYLDTLGVAVPGELRLEWVSGLSADGTTLTGTFRNIAVGGVGVFVATIPTPGVLPAVIVVLGICAPYHRRRAIAM